MRRLKSSTVLVIMSETGKWPQSLSLGQNRPDARCDRARIAKMDWQKQPRNNMSDRRSSSNSGWSIGSGGGLRERQQARMEWLTARRDLVNETEEKQSREEEVKRTAADVKESVTNREKWLHSNDDRPGLHISTDHHRVGKRR
jgi:hypothetical protein